MIVEIFLLTIVFVLNIFILLSLIKSFIGSKTRQKIFFILIITAVLFWVLSILITDLNFGNLSISLVASRISFFSSMLISILYYFFVKSFDRLSKRGLSKLDYIVWIPLTTIFAIASLTDLVLKNVELISLNNLKSDFGIIYLPFSLFISLFFIYATIIFYRIYRKEKDLVLRGQIVNMLIGSTLSIIAALVTNLLFPILGLGEIRSLGPITLIFFLGFTYYSILRYRFLSVNLVIGKIVYILLISLFPFLIFFALYNLQTFLWGSIFEIPSYVSGYILSILVIYLFLYVNKKLTQLINNRIINANFDPSDFKDELSKKISIELELPNILTLINNTFIKAFGLDNIGISIINIKTKDLILEKFIKEGRPLDLFFEYKPFINIFGSKSHEVIIKDELIHHNSYKTIAPSVMKSIIRFLSNNNIDLITPIQISENALGLIFMGVKHDNNAYNLEDISFIETIANIISVSIGRALLYNETKNFAEDLKQKINEATIKITNQKDEISEQLRKERDMMDILGHELRTPLSIARNDIAFVMMQLKNTKEETVAKSSVSRLLSKSLDNIRREAALLQTVLSSTRIENNRLQISFMTVDCKSIVQNTIEGFKEQAETKGLQLLTDLPDKDIFCWGGKEQVQEIVDNLVSNSIKYTQKGKITIVLKDLGTEIKFSVLDTGDGIAKEDIPNLGKKFFRAKTYLDSDDKSGFNVVRPGGTGIGMYVVFGLLKLMNGRINISSELGKGSEFDVFLPKESNVIKV